MGGFPCIVHTIVVVVGYLVVSFQLRIAAGITWFVDDAADAMVIEAAIACSRASADLVEDTRVGSVSGECSGFGQHAVVGLLCRLRLDGFGHGDMVGLHHVECQSRYILLIGIDVEGFVVVIIKTVTLGIAALHVVARQVPFAVALTLTALCWITERGTDEYSLFLARIGRSWLIVVVDKVQLEQAFVALTVVAAIAGILLAVVVVDVVHKVKQHYLVVLRRGTETWRAVVVVCQQVVVVRSRFAAQHGTVAAVALAVSGIVETFGEDAPLYGSVVVVVPADVLLCRPSERAVVNNPVAAILDV